MTFNLQIRTAEELAQDALEIRLAAASAECRRRITFVANETAQINVASAAAAGLLSEEDMAVYRNSLQWVAAMRDAWRGLAEADADITDDANWPDAPEGVVDLASRY